MIRHADLPGDPKRGLADKPSSCARVAAKAYAEAVEKHGRLTLACNTWIKKDRACVVTHPLWGAGISESPDLVLAAQIAKSHGVRMEHWPGRGTVPTYHVAFFGHVAPTGLFSGATPPSASESSGVGPALAAVSVLAIPGWISTRPTEEQRETAGAVLLFATVGVLGVRAFQWLTRE